MDHAVPPLKVILGHQQITKLYLITRFDLVSMTCY